ncbi:oligoendopeptidase F [Schnuerera sp. xch1]|uniref:oligoendopeptidase F n=1 Tax=Schnuerera sp. xch1 TaxID=2874283 RepID=UPI001CC16C7A|nr:oligoendopeptidase F [Schnuerera sp. xch1]MBZ2173984.1 oligoendopeptidase F [Schnuerera sp. xch1]
MGEKLMERKDVNKELTWDLTALFKTEVEFKNALNKVQRLTEELEQEFKKKLNTSNNINNCLDKLRTIKEKLVLVSTYAYLSLSVDQTNTKNQEREMQVRIISSDVQSKLQFIESEIIEKDEEIIKKAIDESIENRHFLKEILRKKPHSLSQDAEKVIASLSGLLNSPYNIYNKAKLADMNFDSFTVDGKEYPLSFILFEGKWEYETNTKIRRAAFKAFSKKLREYQHTIGATYQTQVQTEKSIANLRGFDSIFDNLLFHQKVDRELYNRQIDLIMKHLAPHMRKYAKLLQKIHRLDDMTFADLKLTVDPEFEPTITIKESKKYMVEALSVLGSEYVEMIEKAYDERWIDFIENKGKSTGAFTSSPYGNHPYILISWTEKMREVFVLAHELGHAGHFYLAHQNQNIYNSRPSAYFIEAPSTMNEILMANYLMKNSNEPRMKRWVLSSIISRTYYHNFVTHLLEAAYQREVYKIIDNGGSVHAEKLNTIKRNVLQEFWGDAVEINEGAELTWMRQPHYYMGLYPYTYSAGLTIATEVGKRILNEGQTALEDWKNVLTSGGTKPPIELAKMAGVDITTDKPLVNTIEYIGNMIDEIIALTEELER